jgi:hypothetical protein
MKLQIEMQSIDWWYWAITFIFIGAAIVGWVPAYYIVMLISALQVLHFKVQLKSLTAFDTQVRIVYFFFTLVGLIQIIRLPAFILLFIGTFMVVAFNRCGIALILKKMPWNKNQTVQIQS